MSAFSCSNGKNYSGYPSVTDLVHRSHHQFQVSTLDTSGQLSVEATTSFGGNGFSGGVLSDHFEYSEKSAEP